MVSRLKRWAAQAGKAMGGNLFSILLFLAIALAVASGLRQASSSQEDEALMIAKQGIYRAVVSCYAIEGSYPDSYDYIKQNYGVSVDESKFIVHYEIFASNIMPDISVLKK